MTADTGEASQVAPTSTCAPTPSRASTALRTSAKRSFCCEAGRQKQWCCFYPAAKQIVLAEGAGKNRKIARRENQSVYFDSAASLQAAAPKGAFGQFQSNSLPFKSMHTLLANAAPSLLVSPTRRPAVERSSEGSGRVAWRKVFAGIIAFTKWFEIIMPPADSMNTEHPRIHLADHIRVFLIRFRGEVDRGGMTIEMNEATT
jgi:hypothetical protein